MTQSNPREPSAPFDLSVVDRLLSTTRAVRRRLNLDRAVPRSVLLDCIRLAQQAPTAKNSQNWRWLVLDDPERRQAMGAIYAKGLPLLDAAAKQATDGHVSRVYAQARHFTENIAKVPALVIPCLEERLAPDARLVDATTYYGSIYQSVWSFQLALRSRGLGSVFTTMHLAFEEESRAVLGLPDHVAQLAMLPVAYTKGTEFSPTERPPPETITHFNQWPSERPISHG